MNSHLAQEWSSQWPLPVVVGPDERGRVKAGIFFAGTYLISLSALGLLRPFAPGLHNWPRVLTMLLFSFSVVLTAGLLLFDVALARREVPRIMRDLVHGVA